MAYLIGIDVGTSGTKTVLFDESGKAHASVTEEYPLLTPNPGWTEQNPEDWWSACVQSIKGVIQQSGINTDEIKGIGLSGQMHGSVFLDADNNVVRPAILWNDGRTADECNEITDIIGEQRLLELASNPALTGFTAPKAVWLKNKEPENFKKTQTLCLPKDYVRFRLTGEIAMEVSDGAGTLLFNVKERNWSQDILNALGIPTEWMPPMKESTDVCGTITSEVAKETGLKEGTPVVGGGADNACGATGTGVVVEGRVLASLGTSGVILGPMKNPQTDPQGRAHTFCHSVPNIWYLMGVVLSAGMSFSWFRDTIALAEQAEAKASDRDPYEILTELAGKAPVGSEGLVFLPYLTGERTPHKDPYARGGFIGLTIRHKREHLVRAVLEGITFAMRDSLEILREQGVEIKEVRATGGGAKSAFWKQLQADIYGCEIATLSADQGPAFGAAIMAGVGTGMYKSIPEACDSLLSVVERTEPVAANVKEYNDFYHVYKHLYPSIKNACHTLSKKVSA
ncbi:xylulokinase [bacterium]|nr:xylulokinase [bacterium]